MWSGRVLLGLALIFVLAVAAVAIRAYQIDRAATGLRADVRGAEALLRPGAGAAAAAIPKIEQVDAQVTRLRTDAARLHHLTDGRVWGSAAHLPGFAPVVSGTRRLSDDTAQVASAVLPAYVSLLGDLRTTRTAGAFDPTVLARHAGPVAAANTALVAVRRNLLSAPAVGFGPIDAGRRELLAGVSRLSSYAGTVGDVTVLGPALLGSRAPTHVLVVLQTPAEQRPGGGLVGGYVLATLTAGHVHIDASGSNEDLTKAWPVNVGVVRPDFAALYTAQGAQRDWRESNLSPDFPQVGAIWSSLYRAQHPGAPLDAVVAMTPSVLDALLAVSGPVTLPTGQSLHAGQALGFFTTTLYQLYPTKAVEKSRDAFQRAALSGVVGEVLGRHLDLLRLAPALGAQVRAGGLHVYLTDPSLQQVLATTPLAGALPDAPGPFLAVDTVNLDGSKLDAYVHPTVTYRRSAASQGRQQVTVTVTVTNLAPASGLPPYVTLRADCILRHDCPPGPPGAHRLLIAIYLSTDATDPSVSLDGHPISPTLLGREEGHVLVWVQPPLLDPAGGSHTVTVRASEPASSAAVEVLRQPSIVAETLSLR